MRNHSMFITVEGTDGAGKTNVLNAIDCAFSQMNEGIKQTREPGGTDLGENIRPHLINHISSEPTDAVTEALIMLGLRNHHVQHNLLPNLRDGFHISCSRFNDTTRVLQGLLGNRGEFIEELSRLAPLNFMRIRPDVTFFIDVSGDVAWRRVESRMNIDTLDKKFGQYNKADEAWRSWMNCVKLNRNGFSRVEFMNGSLTEQEVFDRVVERTHALFNAFKERKEFEKSFFEQMTGS